MLVRLFRVSQHVCLDGPSRSNASLYVIFVGCGRHCPDSVWVRSLSTRMFAMLCHSLQPLQEHMSDSRGRPCALFFSFSNGGRTTVEVLNPASAFGVSSPTLPPHLVLGRNVHSFGFFCYGWGGPGFPILNVGGMGGKVSQK